MEVERLYILKRELAPVTDTGEYTPPPGGYAELYHFQSLDEAIYKLYSMDLNEFDKVTAETNHLPFYANSTTIIDATSGDRRCFLSYHQIYEHDTNNGKPILSRQTLSLELSAAKDLLGTKLKHLYEAQVPYYKQNSTIPLGEFKENMRHIKPADDELRLAVLALAAPKPPLLADYSCILHINQLSKGEFHIHKGTPIKHIIPSNSYTYMTATILETNLEEIGKTASVRIMDWQGKKTYLELRRKRKFQSGNEPSLYLEFASEIHRLLMETTTANISALSKNQTALSILIGQYGIDGRLRLTDEFIRFRQAFMHEFKKLKTRHMPAIQPDSTGNRQKRIR